MADEERVRTVAEGGELIEGAIELAFVAGFVAIEKIEDAGGIGHLGECGSGAKGGEAIGLEANLGVGGVGLEFNESAETPGGGDGEVDDAKFAFITRGEFGEKAGLEGLEPVTLFAIKEDGGGAESVGAGVE